SPTKPNDQPQRSDNPFRLVRQRTGGTTRPLGMKRIASGAPVALLVLWSYVVPATAAGEASDVVVEVTDAASGAPVSLARVILVGETGAIGYTDTQGRARFESVPTGAYRAEVLRRDYAGARPRALRRRREPIDDPERAARSRRNVEEDLRGDGDDFARARVARGRWGRRAPLSRRFASASSGAAHGSLGGNVAFRTVQPTRFPQERATLQYGSGNFSSAQFAACGSLGNLGYFVQHVSRGVVSPLTGLTFTD
ncbi:MAG: hypothetical protein JWO85_2905, partial [Candidatus Eremiobacteraeota bacterium]|nr:hypothetical protein [Candidatus Eremiobacteraeota bacterium]